jgi:hypothetical protein
MMHVFSFCSWKSIALTVISLHFRKLIEIQATIRQVFLHITEGSFVRVRTSEQDVNACWKEETYLCRNLFQKNCSWLYCDPRGIALEWTQLKSTFIQLHFSSAAKMCCQFACKNVVCWKLLMIFDNHKSWAVGDRS